MITCDYCGKQEESEEGWSLVAIYDLPIPWLDNPSPTRRVICRECRNAVENFLNMRERAVVSTDCDEGRVCPKCGTVMILCEDEKTCHQYWECAECGYKEDD